MILRYDPASEFLTSERRYITELANVPGDGACSIALARVRPGVTTELPTVVDMSAVAHLDA